MKNEDSFKFMLEEYKNIANTHDKLRDNIITIFNYFLIISAIPFTLLNFGSQINYVYEGFNFLALFFIIVSVGDALLSLSMLHAKFTQYTYAKTVNLIRKYFVDNDKDIDNYLFLPKTAEDPKYKNPGFVKYQIIFIIILALVYLAIGLMLYKLNTKTIFFIIFCFSLILFSAIFLVYKSFEKNVPCLGLTPKT